VHPNALAIPGAGAEQEIDRILDFWAMVNNQDISAVENVHRGLQSRAYPGGRMCFRFEEPVWRFQNMVIDLMTGKTRTPPGDSKEEYAPLEAYAAPVNSSTRP
jgi:choline monooxygenase